MNLPRRINRESALQAANPALEMARLTSMLGVGSQSFAALSVILIAIAALSIFAGLAGSLENRMGDLAVLRAVGYSRRRVFTIMTCEGMVIVICGLILGLVMGLCGFVAATYIITPLQASGAGISITLDFILVLVAVLLAGFIAALLPACRASRVDVARQLSRNA
jgi:putative ABC transport system permease protein